MKMSLSNISIKKAVEGKDFPLLLRIRDRCIAKGKTVLKKGQYVTVLQHKKVLLLTGNDTNGRHFMIDKQIQDDVVPNVIREEMQPKTGEEVVKIIKTGQINTITVRKEFRHESIVLSTGEYLTIHDREKAAESQQNSLECLVKLTRETDGSIIQLPTKILLSTKKFAFQRYEPAIDEDFENLIERNKSVFFKSRLPHEASLFSLPTGVVTLTGMKQLDVIVTVTMPMSSKYLLFETYPLDKRVKVDVVSDVTLPKTVLNLGANATNQYKEKLREIDILTHVDCYAPRYHRYYAEENLYQELDAHLACEEEMKGGLDALALAYEECHKAKYLKGLNIFRRKETKQVHAISMLEPKFSKSQATWFESQDEEREGNETSPKKDDVLSASTNAMKDGFNTYVDHDSINRSSRPLPPIPYTVEPQQKQTDQLQEEMRQLKLDDSDVVKYMSMHAINDMVNEENKTGPSRYQFVPTIYRKFNDEEEDKKDEETVNCSHLPAEQDDNPYVSIIDNRRLQDYFYKSCDDKLTSIDIINTVEGKDIGIEENIIYRKFNDEDEDKKDEETVNCSRLPAQQDGNPYVSIIDNRRLQDIFFKSCEDKLASIDITNTVEGEDSGNEENSRNVSESFSPPATDCRQRLPSIYMKEEEKHAIGRGTPKPVPNPRPRPKPRPRPRPKLEERKTSSPPINTTTTTTTTTSRSNSNTFTVNWSAFS